MFDKDDYLARRSFTVQKILQATDIQTTELITDKGGKKLVLKTYHKKSKATEIEKSVLSAITGMHFNSLVLPQLVESGDDHLLMTYIDREHQTRDTITQRKWSDSDISLFCSGIQEFQKIRVEPEAFSCKQRAIGFIYPVIKYLLLIKSIVSSRLFSVPELLKMIILSFGYTIVRPTFKNVLTHYDLTTYNYAFTCSNKMSIIDFELAYYLGDPLFDVAYFVTIPPVAIKDWTFQKEVLAHFMETYGNTYSKRLRLRFILLICCIVRYDFFKNQKLEQSRMANSIKTLLSEDWSQYI